MQFGADATDDLADALKTDVLSVSSMSAEMQWAIS